MTEYITKNGNRASVHESTKRAGEFIITFSFNERKTAQAITVRSLEATESMIASVLGPEVEKLSESGS